MPAEGTKDAPAAGRSAGADRTAPTLARSILGRTLHASVASRTLAGWLDRHWRHADCAPEPHPYQIRFEEVDAADEADPGLVGMPGDADGAAAAPGWTPVDVRLPDGLTLRWTTRGDAWRWTGPGAGVVARFEPGAARIAVWGADTAGAGAATTGAGPVAAPAPRAAPPPSVYPALYLALCEALRASGLIPLHAAVVVKDGQATALTAASGTGKTTTLLRLLEQGWSPLAEDLSWLDPSTLTLYGWDRGVRLWADGLARLPAAWRERPWRVDVDGKRFLDWAAIEPARVRRATLRRLILLERDARGAVVDGGGEGGRHRASPSSLHPLPRRDAVRTLWEATGVPLTPAAREAVALAVGTLARRLSFARLRLGALPLPALDDAD